MDSKNASTSRMGSIEIVVDDLMGPEVKAVLESHLAFCREQSPPESVHALDLDGLRRDDITFWTARRDGQVLGCIALKELAPLAGQRDPRDGGHRDGGHGEIKSMHTLAAARGCGIGRALVDHLISVARARGYRRLSLETGTMAGFAAARRLYESYGFRPCPPFGAYFEDPNSVCMTLAL